MKSALYIFLFLFAAFSFNAVNLFAKTSVNRPVIIIPVNGEIEEGLAHIVERGVKEAELNKAAALILDMDTYGGKVQAAESIMQAIARLKIPTYTYVNTKAISAGALISASTKYIYMAPQSQIGDAKIIQMSPVPFLGGAKEIDKGLKEKAYSAVRAIVRSACEKNDHPYQLFEAMMDEDIEITNVIKSGKLLTFTASEAVTQKLAVAIAPTLDDMIESIGLADAPQKVIITRSGEHLARFFSSMMISGLLLVLGLGGLFIEIKTPGFGVPGIIGITCIALFFWGHYTANLTGWFPVAAFIIGTILLILEIFVIPGFGVAGISGIILMVGALILAMIDWVPGDWSNTPSLNEISASIAVVAGSIIGAIALIMLAAKFLPRAPVVRGIFLADKIDKEHGYTAFNEKNYEQWINKTGIAKTTLRPAGKAIIDGILLDVVSQGDFINKNSQIKVVHVDSNHIVVEKAT
ncbi:MAG: hypothetical protein DRI44_05515 [Chlamydiae bacterium]|nr:MAG: hypothetical protein DRI44_05515 [Chlamydiota bacterium]